VIFLLKRANVSRYDDDTKYGPSYVNNIVDELATGMLVLFTVGPKCTLATSHAAPGKSR